MSFHHKSIKKFSLEGDILDDASIPRLKEEYIRLLISQMRVANCVPRVDINPSFTTKYDAKKKIFKFKVTVYGINVGKEKIKCIVAVDEHRPIYTQTNRLDESLQGAV